MADVAEGSNKGRTLKCSLNLAPLRELLTLARVFQWSGEEEVQAAVGGMDGEIANRGNRFKKFCCERQQRRD